MSARLRGFGGLGSKPLLTRVSLQLPVCHRAHDATVHGHLLGLLCGHDYSAYRGRERASAQGGGSGGLQAPPPFRQAVGRAVRSFLLWSLPPRDMVRCPTPQVMKTMGLNNAVHWVAWFITGFVQLSISVTALTAILKYGQVLMHSHVLIIWLFLAVYAVATIMFW